MKFIKIYPAAVSLAISAGIMMTGCQNNFDEPGLIVPEATMTANTTIAQFKAEFGNEMAIQIPQKPNGEDYILKGRVCSSDASGNIYQNLEFQDATGAMVISVRRPSLYEVYHLGQEIVLNVSGLWFGQYNSLRQLGWLGEPYNDEPQITFMAYPELAGHVELNGMPAPETKWISYDDFVAGKADTSTLYGVNVDIDRLPVSGEEMINFQGQLVQLNNVSFVDDSGNPTGGVETYAPYQENANRYVKQEGSSLRLTVRNSGYATFYNDLLPEGTGSLRGILSWYGNGSSSNGAVGGWQLLIRSIDDVIFDSEGSRDEPYSVEQAIEMQAQGYNAWVEGYIVGSVKAGLDGVVDDNSDIIYGPDAELTNNIVIAASPEVADWKQCLVVELPQNTDLRTYGNLADNKDNYKKKISLKGNFEPYMGAPGVTENPGSPEYFSIEGLNLGGSGVSETIYSGLSSSSDFTFDNVLLPSGANYIWMWDGNYKYLKASAFISGNSLASDSWAVSPTIDLAGYVGVKASFQHCVNKFPDLAFAKSSVSMHVREVGGAWEEIPLTMFSDNNSWNFVGESVSIPSKFNGKKVQLGFRYTSEDGKSGTWEIKELTVSGEK